MRIWDILADNDPHEGQALRTIHRVFVGIGLVFLALAAFTLVTRWDMSPPPNSTTYGTRPAASDMVIIP